MLCLHRQRQHVLNKYSKHKKYSKITLWIKSREHLCLVKLGLKLRQEIKKDGKNSTTHQDADLRTHGTYHMSRVWPGHKVSAFEQPMPHMSTLWPQIPQLFVRRWRHTDTWMVTTQAQRGEKTKDMKREIQEVHKIETEKKKVIILSDCSSTQPCSRGNCSMSWLHYCDDTQND